MSFKRFALVVFAVHTLFELTFGANAFTTGTSSQSAQDGVEQTTQMMISTRFLGSALLTLGALGALIIFRAGVTSPTARLAAIAFTVFHGMGAIGVVIGATQDGSVLSRPLTVGALAVHALLAAGFIVVAIRLATSHAYERTTMTALAVNEPAASASMASGT